MFLKDFIKQLQELYDSYDDEYKNIRGEPEIVIDSFKQVDDDIYHRYQYNGFSPDIKIIKTPSNYNIINGFSDES